MYLNIKEEEQDSEKRGPLIVCIFKEKMFIFPDHVCWRESKWEKRAMQDVSRCLQMTWKNGSVKC